MHFMAGHVIIKTDGRHTGLIMTRGSIGTSIISIGTIRDQKKDDGETIVIMMGSTCGNILNKIDRR